MLQRINIRNEKGQTTFRLEGRLSEAWFDGLRRCYDEATQTCPNVVVDLEHVTSIDEAGSRLLAEMSRYGVVLVAADPLMKSIIDEVSLREVGKR
ncbi:MAG: STAS domain-containing protein [Terriglobia bacterium]|nr:STAS domain-containing protein [Terriglobia bacterium]